MKKLMILTSAVVMACGLQAATYDWGFSGKVTYDVGAGEKRFKTGTAFLFIGTVGASESAFMGLDAATFVTTAAYDADLYAYGSFDESASSPLVSTDASQKYSLILIQKAGATTADLANYEGAYILSNGDSVIKNIPGSGSAFYASMVNDTEYSTAGWSTMSAVPEPTSGLLLLLGVAGLALRRRRA